MKMAQKEISWSRELIRKLRAKRSQEEFGALLGVPKNTVWRWESRSVKPAPESARKLSALAEKERFLKDWKLAGSLRIVGDLEEGSRRIRKMAYQSLLRSARLLDD